MATWRFLATRLDTHGSEDLLNPDLPVTKADFSLNLSAPTDMSITLPMKFSHIIENGMPLITPWSTAIYAERNGVILGGGIVDDTSDDNGVFEISVVGFVGYLQDMWFDGEYGAYNADPLDLARYIWAHVQSRPGGNLGLAVSPNKSTRRVGTKGTSAFRGRPAIKDAKGNVVTAAIPPRAEIADEPFLLSWYRTSNLLDEFNKLSQVTPFDYAERHAWLGDHLIHRLDLGYPAIGRRRTDLRFIAGENLHLAPKVYQQGQSYASEIVVLGAGEGSKMVKGIANRQDSGRLRRVSVVSDPSIPSPDLATKMATNELKFHSGSPSVTEMTVTDSPNAPLGAFNVGDLIFVQLDNGWFDSADMWVRITSITYDFGEAEAAKLTVVKEGE